MAKTLDVYLLDNIVGQLIQDINGRISFIYNKEWLNNPEAIPLSQSLPLQEEPFTEKVCKGYFSGILPEANMRTLIARNLGISARNDFAMLEQIGGECAGAVTFIPAGELKPNSEGNYRSLTEKELANIIRELPTRPLLAGKDGIRLSLAGVQDKVPVYIENGNISIPLDSALSTHIIKPNNERFKELIFNEALCLNLASIIGLPTARVEIASVEDMDYLLIERFDRKVNKEGKKVRLHQEDFCQALGVVSEMKYEPEGGPSMKTCFNLIRKISSRPVIDLQYLLDAVIFNFLIGNNDAHGKNFSILYNDRNNIGLAPLYDIVCTTYYTELSNKMAMKIGGEYVSDKVLPKHFEKLAEDAGFAKPRIKERVLDLTKKIIKNLEEIKVANSTTSEIKSLIMLRCARTLQLFNA